MAAGIPLPSLGPQVGEEVLSAYCGWRTELFFLQNDAKIIPNLYANINIRAKLVQNWNLLQRPKFSKYQKNSIDLKLKKKSKFKNMTKMISKIISFQNSKMISL